MDIHAPVLEGRFVRLEPLSPSHEAGLRAAAADPRIWRYLPVDASTGQAFSAWFAEALETVTRGEHLAYAVRDRSSGDLVGSTRYMEIVPADDRLEVGYTWYVPTAWGGPVNPECKRLLLGHAFDRLGAFRVELRCDARNDRSRQAISRLGAAQEGVLRSHKVVQHGFRRDTVVFAILRAEWPPLRDRLDDRLRRHDDGMTRSASR